MDSHPTSRFEKIVHRNLSTPITYHKNKWDSTGIYIKNYYVVRVIAIHIYKIWSANQHRLQGGHRARCHNWRHTSLHMS
jgi:hypothetical protein